MNTTTNPVRKSLFSIAEQESAIDLVKSARFLACMYALPDDVNAAILALLRIAFEQAALARGQHITIDFGAYVGACDAAVAAEREACAKVCEGSDWVVSARECALAIRARSTAQPPGAAIAKDKP